MNTPSRQTAARGAAEDDGVAGSVPHPGVKTRILTRSQTRRILDLDAVTADLRRGLAYAATDNLPRERMSFDVDAGSFHLVTGAVHTNEGPRFVTKVNGWFGVGVTGFTALCDAEEGSVLAFMDSAALTQVRTAALTAVAAEALAAPHVECVGLLGAGQQASMQAPAVRMATGVDRLLVWDVDRNARTDLVHSMRKAGFDAQEAVSAEDCASRSEVVVSVTPSVQPILDHKAVKPGTLVIALGADAPGKREHETALLRRAKVITDITSLCARYGELQHPIAENQFTINEVHAELGAILAGLRPGRESPDDTILFDSTGNAVQDAVAASNIESHARREQIGTLVDLRE